MSRPRFLADHDLNEHVVIGVLRREPEIEFKRARELGIDTFADADVLEYAAAKDFIVVSHDVNTMPAAAHKRLANGKKITGLFMVQQTDSITSVIESLVLIWSASETEEWANQVTYLPLT